MLYLKEPYILQLVWRSGRFIQEWHTFVHGFLAQINFYLCQSKYCHAETASQFEHVYLADLPPGDASAAQQTGEFCPERDGHTGRSRGYKPRLRFAVWLLHRKKVYPRKVTMWGMTK
jgi:hypothetical protein